MQVLYWFEAHRTAWMDTIMSTVTHLGAETAFIVIAIFVFWCVNKRHGYYLLAIGFMGTLFNQFLKLCFRIPRPWVLDEKFTIVESARADATGYSFPSGHTQSAVGTLGGVARFTQRNWLRIVCIVLAALVSVSRMYLGVHTPKDVLVSLVIAVILVFALYPIIERAVHVRAAMGRLMMVMLGSMPTLDLTGVIRPAALAFAFLYLPLLPIRRMLTVAFVCSEKKTQSIEAAK